MQAAPNVIDVDAADFEASVLEESKKRPVVVDFWAPWCGPCRFLGPVLEKLAGEFDGDFLLVRFNTDDNPEFADALDIRSIPDVKLFRDGRVVDELLGAAPEHEVRAFLRRHCPSPADTRFAEAMASLQAGNRVEAAAFLKLALEADRSHAPSLLELGKLLAEDGNYIEAVASWSASQLPALCGKRLRRLKRPPCSRKSVLRTAGPSILPATPLRSRPTWRPAMLMPAVWRAPASMPGPWRSSCSS